MGLLNSIEGDKVYIDTNIFIYAIEVLAHNLSEVKRIRPNHEQVRS